MEKQAINIHADLIDQCKLGDQIAQGKLYQLYSKAMFNTALRILGRYEDAEDVLQEAFVNAFRNIESYRAEASFGAWLKRIVVNKSISLLRRSSQDFEVYEAIPDTSDVDERDDYLFSVDQIRAATGRLSVGFRSVLTLYLFEGFDHKEIAEILGISESTSKSQYKRAKDKLRKMLTKEKLYG